MNYKTCWNLTQGYDECDEIKHLRAALAAKDAEIERLKRFSRHPDDIIMLNQQQTKIIEQEQIIAAKDAEVERLRAEVETLAWNLGGISTLACSRKLVEFDSSMARPALHDVAALVKDYSALASTASEPEPETCVWTPGNYGWWITGCNFSTSTKYEKCPGCGKRVEVRG